MDLIAAVRKSVRGGLCALGRDFLAPVVAGYARRPETAEIPITVHLLLSRPSWKMGLLAFHSFEHFTGRRWRLFIHDDGSLDGAARAALNASLPGARWVDRAEADQRVLKLLKNHPACRRHRAGNIYSLKFFDSLAFAPESHYVVLDADVLFYAPAREITAWADARPAECWFNQEEKESYGAPRAEIEEGLGIPLWQRVNSGLSLVCRRAMSLEWSEKFLSLCEQRGWNQHVLEQALFAVSASAFGQGGVLPTTYEISTRILHRRGSVCRHYVGPFKNDILYVEGPANLLLKMIVARKFA